MSLASKNCQPYRRYQLSMTSRRLLDLVTFDSGLEEKGVPINKPKDFDVLLGKGQGYVTNPGNRRYHECINLYKNVYNHPSTSKAQKTKITMEIVHFVKNGGNEEERGRFLRRDMIRACWFEVNDSTSRLKVSQALRYTRRSPSGAATIASAQMQTQISLPSYPVAVSQAADKPTHSCATNEHLDDIHEFQQRAIYEQATLEDFSSVLSSFGSEDEKK